MFAITFADISDLVRFALRMFYSNQTAFMKEFEASSFSRAYSEATSFTIVSSIIRNANVLTRMTWKRKN